MCVEGGRCESLTPLLQITEIDLLDYRDSSNRLQRLQKMLNNHYMD